MYNVTEMYTKNYYLLSNNVYFKLSREKIYNAINLFSQ